MSIAAGRMSILAWVRLALPTIGAAACGSEGSLGPRLLGAPTAEAAPAPATLRVGWGAAASGADLRWAPPFDSDAEAVAAFGASGLPFGWSSGTGGLVLARLPIAAVSPAADSVTLNTTPAVWVGPPGGAPPEGALALWVQAGDAGPAAAGWTPLPDDAAHRRVRLSDGWQLVQARSGERGSWIELLVSPAEP